MLAIACLILLSIASAQRVENLTVGSIRTPALGVDIYWQPHPAFSWQTSAAQTAYQLQVTSSSGAIVYDTGKVVSAQTTLIPYAGTPLLYDADYTISLTSFFGATPVSLAGTFATGLDSLAWASSAQWLAGCTTGQQAPQLRASFALSSAPIVRARAYASGVGLYSLHLNGARVGGGEAELTPGWSTVPTVRVLADTHDVAAALLPGGENVVGLRLGAGKYGYVYEFCHAGDATCYAGVLRLVIEQSGGNVTTIETTPATWTCAPSPITFQHLFHGESFNESLEQAGWNAPGFAPAAPWAPARLAQPNVTLLSTGVPPIRNAALVTPVAVAPAPGSGHVLGGGKFIIASSGGSPNVYFWPDNTTTKFFVQFCTMCSLDLCSSLVPEPPALIAGLTTEGNFSCSQLPAGPSPWVFDLGRNMAGSCTLQLPAAGSLPPGSTLTLVHGEILSASGSVENTFGTSGTTRTCPVNTINCADQLDSFTTALSGSTATSFTPTFTFHGFRYVALFGWPAAPAPPPTAATLQCHQQYSGMGEAGGLSFNSTLLNRLQAAIVATQKSNFFSIPSDCPTREKRGWAGDAQVSVAQALYNLKASPLYQNFVRSMAETSALGCNDPGTSLNAPLTALGPQRPPEYLCCGTRSEFGCQKGLTPLNATGSLPDVVPFDSISGWPGDWVWATAGVEIPAYLMAHEGDTGFLALVFPYIWALLEFASANTQGGLIRWGPYADWLATEGVTNTWVENFYLSRAALQASEMASSLGLADKAAALLAFSASVGTALVEEYFSPTEGVWKASGGMNLQAMALVGSVGGAATHNATATIIQAMLADAEAHTYHTTAGLASVRWILAGLALAGNASGEDAALRMASTVTSPGWGYMVATDDMPGTIWESWGGDAHTSDGSKNHRAFKLVSSPHLSRALPLTLCILTTHNPNAQHDSAMFTGGVGVWLYESALGLRFSHRLLPDDLPTPSTPCPHFSFSPRTRLGMGHAYADAACAAVTGAGEDTLLGARLAHVQSLLGDPPAPQPTPKLHPTLTLAPSHSIIQGLRAASGHYDAPSGRCALSWALTATGFALNATVPHGVTGHLALPLSLLRQLPRLRLVLSEDSEGVLVDARVSDAAASAACQALPSAPASERFPLFLCGQARVGAARALTHLSLASDAEVEGLGRQFGVGQGLNWGAGSLLLTLQGGEYSLILN